MIGGRATDMATVLQSDGRLVIPKAMLEELGLGPGSSVELAVIPGDGLMVRPVRPEKAARRFRHLLGIGQRTLTTDEIMSLTRGED